MKKDILIFCLLSTIKIQAVFSQGVWLTDTSKGFIQHSGASSAVFNNKIYIIGGTTGGADEAFTQIFDPISHIWSRATGKDLDPGEGIISQLVNEKIYVIGGLSLHDTVYFFDLQNNTWNKTLTHGKFTPRWHITGSVVNNKIYVIGGDTDDFASPAVNILEVFDPSTNTWDTPMTTGSLSPRWGLSSAVVNGKIYVMGGNDTSYAPLGTLEVFDPATNSWSKPQTNGSMYPRQFFTSCVLDNKIYVIGGDMGGMISPTNSVQIFDPATNTWSDLIAGGHLTPRMQLASAVVNGKIYVLGGYTPHQELNTVEVYDPNGSSVPLTLQTNTHFSLITNPITSSADFQFSPLQSPETFALFDLLGRQLLQREVSAGESSFNIDMQKYPGGIYFARLGGESVKVVKN